VLDTAQNIFLVLMWVILSIAFLILLNRFWAPARRRAHNDVIGWQISIIGTIYAVMIGFMLFVVWTNFQTAETNADNEANSLVNLSRTADGLPAAQRDAIHIAASNYANEVLTQEWPTMSRGMVAHHAQIFIMQLWAITTHTPAQNYSQQACLLQAMRELSDLTQHRRVRILESRTQMPTILWAVLVIGGMITIASCCLIGSQNIALHFTLIFALSLLISLALVAIADIDRPFQGTVHVSSYAFVRAQGTMLSPGTLPDE
jgi:hypothetical protein